jgi:DNA-directed RNA polymerase subunit RPC12/RpoP
MMQACPNCGRPMRLLTGVLSGRECRCPDCGRRHFTPDKKTDPYWKCDNCQARVMAQGLMRIRDLEASWKR